MDQAFVFVDLAGFTALTEAHGDQAAAEQVGRLVSAAKSAIDGRGRLIKSIGDAVMLCSGSPSDAVIATVGLVEALYRLEQFPLARAGVHFGPAVEVDGDWIGGAVNLASRVADFAHGGQLVVTDAVAQQIPAELGPLEPLGPRMLKNVAQPVELFELRTKASQPVAVDPVCRMAMAPGTAAGGIHGQERDYWFCSLDCARLYEADPSLYAPG